MPTLKVARRKAGASTLTADFESVWGIETSLTVAHEGRGLYSYVGTGDSDVGQIKSKNALDPNRSGGFSTFEVSIYNTGLWLC